MFLNFMDNNLNYRYDAYCGLYCGSCEMLITTKKNELDNIAKRKGLDNEGVKCYGCKTDIVYEHCRNCHLKKCAKEKSLDFCYECKEYPCSELNQFRNDSNYPYHIEVFDNLQEVKEKGLNEWLKNQKLRWSCPSCKLEFMWYTMKCEDCGKEVKGYNRPEIKK